MGEFNKIEIFGVNVASVNYSELSSAVENAMTRNQKLAITYANANTLNQCWKKDELIDIVNSFDILHPDGIGVYLASKFIYGKNGFKQRTSGSDFYPLLIQSAIKNKWSFYFFGHDKKTLDKINPKYPELNVAGFHEGYNFNDDQVINLINSSNADILIAGLGFPKQDRWIYENKNKINCKVIIAVGEGIKVFAGTKIRGPKILRALGFEWLVRFFTNPFKYFARYILGIPIFLCRIIVIKFTKLNG
jgi:N-acetylglucosaminyldiphosphoundecaprenol N-acetyl-beta-D-mannosaminyltransferase